MEVRLIDHKKRGLILKLPWDRNYLKICLHIVFTLVATYIIINLVDAAAFIITDLWAIIGAAFSWLGRLISLFSPLIIAFIIAYLFDPVVDFYQKHYDNFKANIVLPWLKKNNVRVGLLKRKKERSAFKTRFAGAILTYMSIFFVIFIIVRLLINSFTPTEGEGSAMDGLVQMVNNTMDTFNAFVVNLNEVEILAEWDILETVSAYIASFVHVLEESVLGWITTFVTTAVATGAWFLNFFISLVVAFYFMNHKARLKHQIARLMDIFLPKKVERVITAFFSDVHHVFSGYIRGLILDGIILGTLIGITLSIIGVEMAIPIGILTAIFNLIPYFGGIMAFVLSVGFELILGEPINALYAAIAIIIIQQIDTIFIVPRVVGQGVKLSAPVVMLSLTIAGSMFGIIGMLLIVPVIAIIKIFVMRFIERYATHKNRIGRDKKSSI